jgi:hypothetical protein
MLTGCPHTHRGSACMNPCILSADTTGSSNSRTSNVTQSTSALCSSHAVASQVPQSPRKASMVLSGCKQCCVHAGLLNIPDVCPDCCCCRWSRGGIMCTWATLAPGVIGCCWCWLSQVSYHVPGGVPQCQVFHDSGLGPAGQPYHSISLPKGHVC